MVEFLFFKMQITDFDSQVALWSRIFERTKVPGETNSVCVSVCLCQCVPLALCLFVSVCVCVCTWVVPVYLCAYESVWGATLLLHSNRGEGIALSFALSQKHGIKNHLAAGMSPSALSWERSSVRGFQACSVPPSTR